MNKKVLPKWDKEIVEIIKTSLSWNSYYTKRSSPLSDSFGEFLPKNSIS